MRKSLAIPFNQGSDARLRGAALSCNPYYSYEEVQEYKSWRDGWFHVDGSFGSDLPALERLQACRNWGLE